VYFSFEQAPVGLAHIAFDGQILQIDESLSQMLGFAAEDLLQRNYFASLLHIADLDQVRRAVQPLLNGSADSVVLEHRCFGVDGMFRVQLSFWCDEANAPQHFVAILQKVQDLLRQDNVPLQSDGVLNSSDSSQIRLDRTSQMGRQVEPFGKEDAASERARIEAALHQKTIEMEAIFEAFPDVFVRLSTNGKILDYRVQSKSELFLQPPQWQEMTVRAFLPERVSVLFEGALAQVIQNQTPVSLEYSLIREQIKHFYEARLVPVNPQQVIAIIRNISDRKYIEGQLLHDALHDALTGLPNRTLFMDRLEMSLRRSNRLPKHLFAVLFIDLDGFKLINDSLGHVIGDRLLIAIAELLRQCIRSGDTVARLGGDEFTVLLDDIKSLLEVRRVADRIQELLKTPIDLDGNAIFAGASIGIVLGSPSYTKAVDLLRDADIALYQAKESGKGRYAIFDQQMYTATYSRQQLETHLRQALSQQQLCVYYQPIVALDTGRIAGFEALVRWNHPQRGLIPAYEFVPVAEETGTIIPIGLWVLREACIQLRAWQSQFVEARNLQITVNLSSKQLKELKLADLIHQTLIETGISGHQLKLELTESSLIENAEVASEIWTRLRALDIQFSLDDFGTGYCSLSYLHKFAVNTVKVDRSFVHQMTPENRNTKIVRAIVNLSRSLEMTVVAEGIETEEQLQQLHNLGCDFGQGYLFSQPLDQNAATALLGQNEQFCIFPAR
jgi:diguanylate cyclase (GGDEF)-like protein